jgi:predicted PolB exonuclease-like 3'-5' exonuclease
MQSYWLNTADEKHYNTMHTLYLDIETAPLGEETIKEHMPTFDGNANTKDPVKIAAQIAEKEEKWLEKCQLRASTSYVCAIGMSTDNEPEVCAYADSPDQEQALLTLVDYQIKQAKRVITFHGNSYDLPMLERRAWSHKMNLGLPKFRGYYPDKFLDLADYWNARTCTLDDGNKLANIATFLGLPTKTASGKDFYKWDREKQDEYLKHDVWLNREIAKMMGLHKVAVPLEAISEEEFERLK